MKFLHYLRIFTHARTRIIALFVKDSKNANAPIYRFEQLRNVFPFVLSYDTYVVQRTSRYNGTSFRTVSTRG